MGKIHFYGSRGKRRALKEVLGRMFQEGDSLDYDTITRRFLENWYTHTLLPMIFKRFTPENVDRYINVEGEEKLKEALAQGKGCILIHGHLGPSQLPFVALSLKGYTINQISYLRPRENTSRIGKIVVKIKEQCEKRIPITYISAKSFMRPAFSALKRNEIVMTAGDGTGEGEFIGKYIPIKFLGGHLNFPIGPISLSRKTGALLLPIFTIKVGLYKYKVIIEDQITLQNNGNKDLSKEVEKFTNLFESYVKKYPCHWYIMDSIQWLDPGNTGRATGRLQDCMVLR